MDGDTVIRDLMALFVPFGKARRRGTGYDWDGMGWDGMRPSFVEVGYREV